MIDVPEFGDDAVDRARAAVRVCPVAALRLVLSDPPMTTAMTRIVVVGNGIAGLTAAGSLRAHGFDGELTIVGGKARAAYSRPALSALLRSDADLTGARARRPTTEATELLGVAATRLDAQRRVLSLEDGASSNTAAS